jgi:uncharacterized Tic20 family protein
MIMESQPELTPEESTLAGMSPEEPMEAAAEKVEETAETVAETVSEPPMEEIPVEEVPPVLPPPPPTAPASPYMAQNSEDRTWSMLAHLSVLLNLVTGILGPVVAIIIYLVYKDRSKYIAYQSMQAFVFQLVCWVGAGLVVIGMWIVTILLSVIVIGLLCIPFSLVGMILLGMLPVISLIYGVVAAIQTSQGKDFRYLWVGDWVREMIEQ